LEKPAKEETTQIEAEPLYVKIIFVLITISGLCFSIFFIFTIQVKGHVFGEAAYYYLFFSIFLAGFFLVKRVGKRQTGIPWYDFLAAALSFGLGFYFFLNAWEIGQVGWASLTPFQFTTGIIYCILMLEAGRRMAGPIFLGICILIGVLYPLLADYLPGIFFGNKLSPMEIVIKNVFGWDGILGMPGRIIAGIVVGFLLFAAFLIKSGAGQFFLDLAFALFGNFRGGPAKVAVIASAFFGSLSGSALPNIVSTGSITIPAMKKMGYPPNYAGAIEACASTAGLLMPPIMGAMAFIMAAFIGVDYDVIIVAATIPSILLYFGLLMQVDAYAGKAGLKAIPREELPSIKKTLIQGWPFLITLAFLVWGLVFMKWDVQTPFYATGLLILLSFRSRKTMMTPRKIVDAIIMAGNLIAQTLAIILPLSFILIGLLATGVTLAITSSFLILGGGNVFGLLVIGMVSCYLLGMVGMVGPAYIFMAISLVPAVLQVTDLNEIALHLFILYYSLLALITPPVANGAFLAAAIAKAGPMRTAMTCMRLAIVLYFIPFFFVFNPSLVMQGPIFESIYLFILCLIGITLIAAGLEGYLMKIGRISFWARPLLVVGGFLIAFPEWYTTFIGGALALIVVTLISVQKKSASSI
jgi:TRAP transporter 4TM/12TM fusion protein